MEKNRSLIEYERGLSTCPLYIRKAMESIGESRSSGSDLEDTVRVELKHLRPAPGVALTSPSITFNFLKSMGDYDREHIKVVYLDTQLRVIGVETISIGSLNQATYHPRESVKGAVLANADSVIIAHNHPSGTVRPSKEDRLHAQAMVDAFDLMHIAVQDVLIIGRDDYYSFREHGKLPTPSRKCEDLKEFKSTVFEVYRQLINDAIHSKYRHDYRKEKVIADLIKKFYNTLSPNLRKEFILHLHTFLYSPDVYAYIEKRLKLPYKEIVERETGAKLEEVSEMYDEYKYKYQTKEGEDDINNKCNIALEAALSTLRKYCGLEEGEKEIEIGGTKVVLRCPSDVYKVAENNELTTEERIEAVKKTAWAQNLVKGWLAKMMPYLQPGTPEYEKAYETMLDKVARGMVL